MRHIFLFWLTAASLMAQVEIGSQTASAASTQDHSAAAVTKPAKAGTSVPGSCSGGALFIKTDAPLGEKLHECDGSTFGKVASLGGFTFTINGGGATITTGIKVDVRMPYACTITKVSLFADQSGSIVIDIWKDTYANYPATDADSITASAPPTISTATKSEDSTLTGWTKTIAAGDVIRLNVDSVTSIQRVEGLVECRK